MPVYPDLVILAGGHSTRLGTDKAELRIEGMPMLERVARAGLAAGLAVRVIGRTQPDWWSLASIAFAPDEQPGLGPLGGLRTAIVAARPVLLVGCDMPALDAVALNWLVGQWRGNGHVHGCATLLHAQLEPLFSIYEPACLPAIDTALAAGRRSLHQVIEASDFARCPVPYVIAPALVNVNTPEDVDELSRLSQRRKR